MRLMGVAAVCALALCGCNKETGKTFTVGFDAEFPPYGFKDAKTGDYRGFDLDLAAEVAKRNGWTLVKKPIVWAAKDSEFNAGTIDCIWNGFTMTEERKDQYTWTEPYVMNKQLVLVRKDSPIKGLDDLKGKVIVAQDGSSGAEALDGYLKGRQEKDATFKAKEVKLVPDYNTAGTVLPSTPSPWTAPSPRSSAPRATASSSSSTRSWPTSCSASASRRATPRCVTRSRRP